MMNTTGVTMDLPALLTLYKRTLFEDVMPFWLRHGIDSSGAINTCIADDGTLLSRDHWNWSQWRAVWVFSKLYNMTGDAEWLRIARGIFQFVTAHGPLDDGHWPLLLDGDGKVLRGYESLYVDGFAMYGLAEYYRATGDEAVLRLAKHTFRVAVAALETADPPPAYPFQIDPGVRSHGLNMILVLGFHYLTEVCDDAEIEAATLRAQKRIMDTFVRTDRNVVLEFLAADGSELPPPRGTVIVPGHAIESMWFQMHIARARGDQATVARCVPVIRRHLELGWDEEFGGLFHAVDADGRDEVGWPHPQTKLWWSQTEALYATLLAYEVTREPWCMEWHERVRDYCYTHYPVPVHGEWRQKLDRQGQPLTQTLILPVKDPFHTPRTLIYNIEVLERLMAEKA